MPFGSATIYASMITTVLTWLYVLSRAKSPLSFFPCFATIHATSGRMHALGRQVRNRNENKSNKAKPIIMTFFCFVLLERLLGRIRTDRDSQAALHCRKFAGLAQVFTRDWQRFTHIGGTSRGRVYETDAPRQHNRHPKGGSSSEPNHEVNPGHDPDADSHSKGSHAGGAGH